MRIQFVENDGGREAAGYKGKAGDCVVRAIAIATEQDYQAVYDELFRRNKLANKNPKKCSPRDGGTSTKTIREYMADIGWTWVPTMLVGKGCQVHLREDELPKGRIVVRLSRHLAAVVNGVLHDTYDCSREGTRCVYGYWKKDPI